MNRIEFLHAIDYGDKQIVDIMVNHLDQCMILYDLVNSSNRVTRLDNTNNSVSFQIDLLDTQSTELLLNKINTVPNVSRYGRNVIHIQSKPISNQSIILQMTKM